MLTKLEVYFFEGETYHISDLNIYFDLRTKQYRHLFFCDDCGVKIGCICYNTLEEAVEDVEQGCQCEVCRIEEALDDWDIENLMTVFDAEKENRVIKFGQNLVCQLFDETLQFYEITREDVKVNKIPWNSLLKVLLDTEKYAELKDFTVSIMTETESQTVLAQTA